MATNALLRFAKALAVRQGWMLASSLPRNGRALTRHLRLISPRRLGLFAKQIRLAWECTKDWRRGRYENIPWATVSSLAAALAYFVLPLDVVPDWIPGAGFLDDAALLGYVLKSAETDLRHYCAWRGLDPDEYFTPATSPPRA
jgi:uncharacterized membrane protein YkvA (DUF1232 family)